MAAAARIVLRDWSIGKFDRYTTPPAPVINTATSQSESSITANFAGFCDDITQLYVNDEAILSTIRTRKERRKQGGLVKFAYGSIDLRKVAVEDPWNGLEQNDEEESDDDEEEEEGQEEVDDEGMDVDGEDEDEDEENEDEEDDAEDEEASDAEIGDSQEGEEDDEDADQDNETVLPRLTHKQKRKRGPEKSMPLPPAKKVSFGFIPPASARGSKADRQKIGRSTTKGKDKLKGSRSKPSPVTATPADPVHKPSERKSKIANVTRKIKPKGSHGLTPQSKDKSESEAYDFGKFF